MFRRAALEPLLFVSLLTASLGAWPQNSTTEKSTAARTAGQTPDDESASAAKKQDAFFSGSVVETTGATLIVSRTVLGKRERHSFAVTSDTKIEGRLRAGSRVTVRYAPGDDGDSALLVVVRAGGAAAKKK